ncbi:MAG TPA: glycosyltransferase family 39 protein [Chitinophagaceae bacterium]
MKLASIKLFQSQHRHLIFFSVLFLIVQGGLLIHYGIYEKEEALKYIYEAGYFMEHHSFSQPKYIFYSGYIFLHVLAKLTATGLAGVYFVQLVLNAFSTYCFYKLTLVISGRRTAAFIATTLLLLCIPFQKWTVYLFTESVFFSLVIIYAYVLFTSFENRYTKLIFIGVLLCILVLLRPTGMLLIPASMVLGSWYLFVTGRKFWGVAIWLPGLAALVVLLDTAIRGKGEFDFIKPYIEQHIICGLPQGPLMPGKAAYENTLQGLISYIADNPGQFVELGFKRLIAFFGLIRSYYSDIHNMLLIAGLYPVYIFASFSIRHLYMRARRFFIFTLALTATFALSVIITCDDWHNRFIMPVMPLIFIFAGVGLTNLYTALFKRANAINTENSSPG